MMTARELIEGDVDYGQPEDLQPEWGLEFRAFMPDDGQPGDLDDEAHDTWMRTEIQLEDQAREKVSNMLRRRGIDVETGTSGDFLFAGDPKVVAGILDRTDFENVRVTLTPHYLGRCTNLRATVREVLSELRGQPGVATGLRLVDNDGDRKFPGGRYEIRAPLYNGGEKHRNFVRSQRGWTTIAIAAVAYTDRGEIAVAHGKRDPFALSDDPKWLEPVYAVTDGSAAYGKPRRGSFRKETVKKSAVDTLADVKSTMIEYARAYLKV